jgi:hypothetical protein
MAKHEHGTMFALCLNVNSPKAATYTGEGEDDEWALVNEVDIQVVISDSFDPRPVQIAGLREALTTVRADAEKKCTEIKEKINKLLAIEHTTKEAA